MSTLLTLVDYTIMSSLWLALLLVCLDMYIVNTELHYNTTLHQANQTYVLLTVPIVEGSTKQNSVIDFELYFKNIKVENLLNGKGGWFAYR